MPAPNLILCGPPASGKSLLLQRIQLANAHALTVLPDTDLDQAPPAQDGWIVTTLLTPETIPPAWRARAMVIPLVRLGPSDLFPVH